MLCKPLDFAVAIPALGLVVASFFWVYVGADDRGVINLKGEGGEWVFPLDAEETMAISGPLGDTVVAIHEGAACVVSSPCVNQSCVAAGTVHSPGQWTACLPNRVMVYIGEGTAKGANANDVDAAVW